MEGALVNSELPKSFRSYSDKPSDKKDAKVKVNELVDFHDKRYKADYISLQLHLMNDLTQLSL
jgi:hypothetical protein